MSPFLSRRLAFCLVFLAAGAASAQSTRETLSESIANQYGLHRAWYTRAQASQGIGRIESLVLDQEMLLVQTRAATLQAIDAETGRTRWVASLGKSSYETMPAGLGKDYAAMSNGSTLYVVRRATGDMAWQAKLSTVPSAGCAVGPTRVFVPLSDGKVDAFLLQRANLMESAAAVHHGVGRAQAAPVVGASRVFWTTGKGHLYADGVDSAMTRFRFVGRGPILSSPCLFSPHVYVTSLDGYCYALNDTTGAEDWHFAAGSPIHNQPVAAEDGVYVVSDAKQLWKLDAKSGVPVWSASGISQFVAVSATRAYASDFAGRLVIFDAKSGARLGTMPTESMTLKYTNSVTDRIILGTESGTLICLHEIAQVKPLVHAPAPVDTKPVKPVPKPMEPAAETPTEPATDNPFGM